MSRNILVLPENVLKQLRSHAEKGYPEEICGALLGMMSGSCRQILKLLPLKNAADKNRHTRYAISPRQISQVEQKARELMLDVLGYYHSHPDSPAVPSFHDRTHARSCHSYLILGVRHGRVREIKSWELNENQVEFENQSIQIVAASA